MTDRLHRFRPPEPPAELRARVLTAARAEAGALATESWIDRWWESRGLRRAWLLAAALLLALRLVPGPGPSPDAASFVPWSAAEPPPQDEIEQRVRQLARLYQWRAAQLAPDRTQWGLASLKELDG